MTTRCFLVENEDGDYWETPGAVFEISVPRNEHGDAVPQSGHMLSEFYLAVQRERDPLMLVLPDGTAWCMDYAARNGPGWEVTGEPPHLTARPSIASEGYHGWLDDGVLSDDLEGRTYEGRTS